ncbi:MAG: hypothetical protein P4L43_16505 [Syntrophobacteraceae bacterium]|nr:hypothetical protein [Syntrophobacteraceae bacterium]
MADIPGFPALHITDEHKSQAEALLETIKKDNPDHADFLDKLGERLQAGAEGALILPFFLLIPFMRSNAGL